MIFSEYSSILYTNMANRLEGLIREVGLRVVAGSRKTPLLPLSRMAVSTFKRMDPDFKLSSRAKGILDISELSLYTAACSTLSLAPIESAPTSQPSLTKIPEIQVQSTLEANTLTEEQFKTNPEIQSAVAQNAVSFTETIKSFLGLEASSGMESISFAEVVKVGEDGIVSATPYSFDFNNQLLGVDGKPVDYFEKNILIFIKNKEPEQSAFYFYSTFANAQGETTWAKWVDTPSPLNKVSGYNDKETNTLKLFIDVYKGGTTLEPTQIIEITDAFDADGNLVGSWKGVNHATGEKLEPVTDGLIGAKGVSNITVDGSGNVKPNGSEFGDPRLASPPTPEIFDISFRPNAPDPAMVEPVIIEAPLPQGPITDFAEKLNGSYELHWSVDNTHIVLVDAKTGAEVPEITFDKDGNWTRAYKLPKIEKDFVVSGSMENIEITTSDDGQVSLGILNWKIENGEFSRKTAPFATKVEGKTVELELTSLDEVHFEILNNSSQNPENRIDNLDSLKKLIKKLFGSEPNYKTGIPYRTYGGMYEASHTNIIWGDNKIISSDKTTGEKTPVDTAEFGVVAIVGKGEYGLIGWIDEDEIGQVRVVDKARLDIYSNFSDWYLNHEP